MYEFDELAQQKNVSSEAAEGSDTTPTVLTDADIEAKLDRFMASDAWRGCHVFTSSQEDITADRHLATLCVAEAGGHA